MRRSTSPCPVAGFALALLACGSRTGLLEETSPRELGDGGAADAEDDARSGVDAASNHDGARTSCTSNADCDDGVACTRDLCERASGVCSHAPDDRLCPPGFSCRPPCAASSFAEGSAQLYGVDLPSGAVTTIGPTLETLDDIALSPAGSLVGVRGATFYEVDPTTGAATLLVTLPGGLDLNALDFGPDGTLYGAGGDRVFSIDLEEQVAMPIAEYPDGYLSSGDLAIVGEELLATVNLGYASATDSLVAVDLRTSKATIVGDVGFAHVYGLAAYGAQLFGYTAAGQVLAIDVDSARATAIASDPGVSFFGASAR